jgi:lipoprotein-anchoring transpeptidase ErfK/SrfK
MFWLGARPSVCQTSGVRLYTRYRPARARGRPWRLWLALVLLSAGLYGWLRWQPREPEQPQEVLLRAAENRAQAKPVVPPPAVASNTQETVRSGSVASAPAVRVSSARTIDRPAPNSGTNALATLGEGRPVDNVFEAQLALARMGLSPGSLDGVIGSRTRNALRMFQQREQLRPTGELDAATRKRLKLREQTYTTYTVTHEDMGRLLPLGSGWVAKSEQPRLDYTSILELVAERSWTHPEFLQRVNPQVDWARVEAGTQLLIPNVSMPEVKGKAAMVRIQLGSRFLQVFDDRVNLIAHFPCTIAGSVDRRPLGELRVEVLIEMPNYTFDPSRFTPTAETRRIENKLILPAGPNNPVGTVWIGLNRPGYGIHGTPEPEKVGGAESLGCFRLANWNAEHLLKLAWVGMPVHVEP